MTTTRKTYSPKFKARLATEAQRGEKTLSQLGSQLKVHPIQIAKWRKTALDQMPELFVDGRRKAANGEVEALRYSKRSDGEQYTETPFFGSRRMTVWLREDKKLAVNRKRVGHAELFGGRNGYRFDSDEVLSRLSRFLQESRTGASS